MINDPHSLLSIDHWKEAVSLQQQHNISREPILGESVKAFEDWFTKQPNPPLLMSTPKTGKSEIPQHILAYSAGMHVDKPFYFQREGDEYKLVEKYKKVVIDDAQYLISREKMQSEIPLPGGGVCELRGMMSSDALIKHLEAYQQIQVNVDKLIPNGSVKVKQGDRTVMDAKITKENSFQCIIEQIKKWQEENTKPHIKEWPTQLVDGSTFCITPDRHRYTVSHANGNVNMYPANDRNPQQFADFMNAKLRDEVLQSAKRVWHGSYLSHNQTPMGFVDAYNKMHEDRRAMKTSIIRSCLTPVHGIFYPDGETKVFDYAYRLIARKRLGDDYARKTGDFGRLVHERVQFVKNNFLISQITRDIEREIEHAIKNALLIQHKSELEKMNRFITLAHYESANASTLVSDMEIKHYGNEYLATRFTEPELKWARLGNKTLRELRIMVDSNFLNHETISNERDREWERRHWDYTINSIWQVGGYGKIYLLKRFAQYQIDAALAYDWMFSHLELKYGKPQTVDFEVRSEQQLQTLQKQTNTNTNKLNGKVLNIPGTVGRVHRGQSPKGNIIKGRACPTAVVSGSPGNKVSSL